ncbi:hypothetical protein PIB30_092262 [Stylosanthes scabra]|uniref:Legume lectin domain-containing protein n=1 Tax=Stylosanthes scabra TaxID=79078 RepID=A0ABU6UXA0_9FABA|nr:hypothetical protein [Stylosanthes scabra]
MASLHFLPLLSAITIFLTLLSKAHSQTKINNQTDFTFTEFNSENTKSLFFQGDAKLSGKIIEITKTNASGFPQKNSVGRVIHSEIVHLWNSKQNPPQFSTIETTFKIRLSSPTREIAGDGLTFFIAPSSISKIPIPNDSDGGYFGLFANNTLPPTVDFPNSLNPIVFVEFDNYVDGRWDPKYKHIGINVNTTRSRAAVPWDRQSGKNLTATVEYNPFNKLLYVSAAYGSDIPYEVSSSVEISNLPEFVRVGFSASTGDNAVETHELLSWTFSSWLHNVTALSNTVTLNQPSPPAQLHNSA